MKKLLSIVFIVMLAACGQSTQPGNRPATGRASEPAATQSSDNNAENNSKADTNMQPGPGSALSGDQSGLNGDSSDFNIEINLSADVLFDFDKADLKPEADPELQKAAEVIKQKGKGVVAITGYTDAKGNDAYNQKLSLNRAAAVKNWFEAQGLKENFSVDGKGAANPVAPNTNSNGSDNPDSAPKTAAL